MSSALQATPHVAGIIASIISAEGNSSPADMIAKLTARAISVLDNDSDGTFGGPYFDHSAFDFISFSSRRLSSMTADGTPNKLAQLNPSSS